MSKLIKEMLDALNAVNQNKTQPFDRQGEVKRIEGKIAWVKLEGSDRETPIQMTIACDVGDTVQARIGGGSAWLTGNLTAPPTDDKKANEAITMVTNVVQEVKEEVSEALEDVSTVDDVTVQYCLSTSSSQFIQSGDWSSTPPAYSSGKYYWTRSVIYDEDGNATYGTPQYSQDTQLSVETDVAFKSNNNHFWHDSSGAYVTTADKSYSSGYATRITSSGILQSYDGKLLSGWTGSGISFYQGDAYNTPTASFGSGGVDLYENGNNVAHLSSTLRLGRTDLANIQIPSVTETSWGYISEIYFYYNGTMSGKIYSGRGGSGNNSYVTTMYGGNAYASIRDENGSLWLRTNAELACAGITSSQHIECTWLQCSSYITCGSITCSGVTSSVDIVASNANVKGSDVYTKCALGEGGSSTANCRLGSTSDGYYRLCLVQGGSSKRYKHDIKPIEEETLDPHRLYDAEVIQFVYNDGYLGKDDCRYNKPLSGFIAEDLHKVYPIAVDVEDGKCETWNERYIIPPMLALIQEQNKRIAELEKRVL